MVFLSIIPPIYANIPFIYPRYCGICHWNNFIRGLQNNNYPTYKPHIWLKCPLLQKDANHFLLQKKGVPVKVVWPNPHPSYYSLCGLVMIKWWFCLLYRQYMPKPLGRSILGIRWKSQGCIYLCSANAMTWARKVNQRFRVKFPETI